MSEALTGFTSLHLSLLLINFYHITSVPSPPTSPFSSTLRDPGSLCVFVFKCTLLYCTLAMPKYFTKCTKISFLKSHIVTYCIDALSTEA